MAHFEPLLWEKHPRPLRRGRVASAAAQAIDPSSEFAARPLGKLGRRLLADVDVYLQFFAAARTPAGGGS